MGTTSLYRAVAVMPWKLPLALIFGLLFAMTSLAVSDGIGADRAGSAPSAPSETRYSQQLDPTRAFKIVE